MPLSRACEVRLVHDVGIALARGVPEEAERSLATGVIPDARRQDAVLAGDAGHLAEPGDWIRHEVDDELGQSRVELAIAERELLGGREPNLDAWMALLRRRDERLRRIDRGNVDRPQAADELSGERAGPAADVEHPLAGSDLGEVGELRRERHRVPTHEPVVGVGGDDEAHGEILGSMTWRRSGWALDVDGAAFRVGRAAGRTLVRGRARRSPSPHRPDVAADGARRGSRAAGGAQCQWHSRGARLGPTHRYPLRNEPDGIEGWIATGEMLGEQRTMAVNEPPKAPPDVSIDTHQPVATG